MCQNIRKINTASLTAEILSRWTDLRADYEIMQYKTNWHMHVPHYS